MEYSYGTKEQVQQALTAPPDKIPQSIILNICAAHLYAKRYLEIGVAGGENFRAIQVPTKVGVDIDPKSAATHIMPSNEYFEYHQSTDQYPFDLIFLDGDHRASHVMDDILSALSILRPDGIMVVHDLNPPTESHQISAPELHKYLTSYSFIPRADGAWNGDGWKAWAFLRSTLYYPMYVLDANWGCGIVIKTPISAPLGKAIPPIDTLAWNDLNANREELLGLTPAPLLLTMLSEH